jgi:CBS domain-containing protein
MEDRTMRAMDVMTTNVLTATPDTQVGKLAALMVDRHVSAVPIVEGDMRLVGIVSEGDLMRRPELGTERRSSWWLKLFADSERLAQDFVKAHGATAADLMTRKVVSVADDVPLDRIASLLEEHHIKRVPVLREGRLVGIVSRADLIRCLASHGEAALPPPPSLDDATLKSGIERAIAGQPWGQGHVISVIVTGGVAHLWGLVPSDAERRAARIAAEEVAGAGKVENHIGLMPMLPAL